MFLRRLFAFVVLPSLLTAAAPSLTAENWNAGLDTTKPGWYFEHPVWKQMKADFEHRYLGLEAALRAQIPAVPDSICLQDSAMHMDRGDNEKWKTYWFTDKKNTMKARFAVLHPTALWARPSPDAAMVGVILPSAAAYRAVREYSSGANGLDWFLMESRHLKEVRTDSLTSMLRHGRPWDYFLLADSTGKPLGWAAWDSLVYFCDSATAAAAHPFYRDGLADFLDGWWLGWAPEEPVFAGRPLSKTNPTKTSFVQAADLFNLRRWTRFTVERNDEAKRISPRILMQNDDPEAIPQWYSQVKDPASGKTISYLDPRKLSRLKTLPLHWFADFYYGMRLDPFTTAAGELGELRMNLSVPTEFDPDQTRRLNFEILTEFGLIKLLVTALPLSDPPTWSFKGYSYSGHKLQAEVLP